MANVRKGSLMTTVTTANVRKGSLMTTVTMASVGTVYLMTESVEDGLTAGQPDP